MQNSALRNIMQKGFGSGFLRKRWQETMCKCIAEQRAGRPCRHLRRLLAFPAPHSLAWVTNVPSHPYIIMSSPGSSISQTSAWETSEHQDLSITQTAENLPKGIFELSLWCQLNISSVTTMLRVSHRFFEAGVWDIFLLFSVAQSIKNFSNGTELGNGSEISWL